MHIFNKSTRRYFDNNNISYFKETEPEKIVKDTGSFDDMTDDFTNLDLKKKKKKKKPKFTDEDDGEEGIYNSIGFIAG